MDIQNYPNNKFRNILVISIFVFQLFVGGCYTGTKTTEPIPQSMPDDGIDNRSIIGVAPIYIKEYNVRLIFRDFLVAVEKDHIAPGGPGYPNFGYYCYLLFSEKTESTYEQRKTAADAFMCQFQDAKNASPHRIEPENIAVFYAPVEKKANISVLEESQSGEDLLEVYDYVYANKLINLLSEKYDIDKLAVSIVATPLPLSKFESKPYYDVVQVISLVDMPSPNIARIVSELRKNITHPAETEIEEIDLSTPAGNYKVIAPVLKDVDNGIDFSLKFRRFLGSLGKLFLTIAPDAQAQDFLCK